MSDATVARMMAEAVDQGAPFVMASVEDEGGRTVAAIAAVLGVENIEAVVDALEDGGFGGEYHRAPPYVQDLFDEQLACFMGNTPEDARVLVEAVLRVEAETR